jgi:hypothetical protein
MTCVKTDMAYLDLTIVMEFINDSLVHVCVSHQRSSQAELEEDSEKQLMQEEEAAVNAELAEHVGTNAFCTF